MARSSCFPAGTRRVAHEPEKTSAVPFRSISICFPSTRKRTDRTRFVELATTTKAAVFAAQRFSAGVIHVNAGPDTPGIPTGLNAVLGRKSEPTQLTFFDFW